MGGRAFFEEGQVLKSYLLHWASAFDLLMDISWRFLPSSQLGRQGWGRLGVPKQDRLGILWRAGRTICVPGIYLPIYSFAVAKRGVLNI